MYGRFDRGNQRTKQNCIFDRAKIRDVIHDGSRYRTRNSYSARCMWTTINISIAYPRAGRFYRRIGIFRPRFARFLAPRDLFSAIPVNRKYRERKTVIWRGEGNENTIRHKGPNRKGIRITTVVASISVLVYFFNKKKKNYGLENYADAGVSWWWWRRTKLFYTSRQDNLSISEHKCSIRFRPFFE